MALSKLAERLSLARGGIWDQVERSHAAAAEVKPVPRPPAPGVEGVTTADRVSAPAANKHANTANAVANKAEARKAYMREHMRKKRAAAKAG